MTEKALEPLAIVGLSLKFPQDATSPESFWDMIMEGRCASTEFPPDRLTIDSHFNPDTSRLDSLSFRGGHFMKDDLSLFDAPFFSITAGEAEAMDPQQRLILEASYRALENAGLPMASIARSKTCIFVGSTGHDYLMLQSKDPQYMQKWNIMGTTSNMLANRVSWFFDLVGPSAAIDTACSSSLMAVDLACQSIWSGDSTMGLAIGSNILMAMETSLMMDNLGLLSKDSHCFSFDQHGNGYSRGEGVGVVVLRPLVDAVSNGDTIRAVIRSSASNQDGRTPGITQPSPKMQANLIQETYRKAKLDMTATRYFEAHGTGTAVGDPIETSAIGSVFRKYRSPEDPLYVGSVKSNIGHLEGGSGIAGFIKTVLALEQGIIPPNSANLQTLNPRIDGEFLNMKFPRQPLPWPSDGLRRASVSSFGYGGSNTHIVLDDAYQCLRMSGLEGNHNTMVAHNQTKCKDNCWSLVGETSSEESSFVDLNQFPENAPKLLVWSVADEKGISRVQETWKSHYSTADGVNRGPDFFKSLAYTLSCRRTHLPWRAFAVARASDSLEKSIGFISSASQSLNSSNLALIFSGQGAQWYAMGRELLDIYPVFRKSLEGAGEYLKTLGCEWNPIEEFKRNQSSSNVNRTEYSQILCTILQVALVDLLRHLKIAPNSVLGHSSGEVAAAYCSRGITRQSAWKVSYYRGNMSNALENSSKMKGSMLAVALSEAEAMSYINELRVEYGEAKVTVGCINSPKSVTLSGEVTQLESLTIKFERDNIFCRMLKVKLAYHSSQMKEIAAIYQDALGELESDYAGHKNWPEMISSVTGGWVNPGDTARASHWVNNMISPVRFSDALFTLCSGSSSNSHKRLDGGHRRTLAIDHILEVGPHSVLQGACKDVLKTIKRDTPVEYISLLIRNTSAADTFLAAIGTLFSAGYPVDLFLANSFDHSDYRSLKPLPNLPEYPFNHDVSYWHESTISKSHRLRAFKRNDLLGVPDPAENSFENRWKNFVRVSEMPWVKDHKINGTKLYPGAGMLVMAIEAAKQVAEKGRKISGFNIEEAKFHAAMVVPSGAAGLETSFHLRPTKGRESKESTWYEFRLCARENEEWTENCTGSIQVVYSSNEELSAMDKRHKEELWAFQLGSYSDVARSCTVPMDSEFLYGRLGKFGYGYGDAFQLINTLSLSPVQPCVVAQIERFTTSAGETIHPTTLDAIMQTSIWTGMSSDEDEIPTAIPTSVKKLWVASRAFDGLSSDTFKTYASKTAESTFLGSSVNIVAFDEKAGETSVSLEGLGSNVVTNGESSDEVTESADDLCHRMQWNPDPRLLTNKEVVDLCRNSAAEVSDSEALFSDMDFIIMARIFETLQALSQNGIKPAKPHLQKYVNWMMHQQQLLDDGQIRFASEPWKGRLVDRAYLELVENRLLGINKRGSLFVNVARNLLGLISGETNPRALLSERNTLQKFYSEEINESHGIRQFGKYLELLSHSNPCMKVIEIGAGSGSMTKAMFRTLGRTESNGSRYAQWDFTDVTSSLFAGLQSEFHEEGNSMRFKVLNIEEDPEVQGFECGTYDLVVACLVSHATSNLKATLHNARKLLKPGGKLVLYEIVIPNIRSTFVFGLLEQFWCSSEPYRTLGPCIETRQWNELFLQTGYSGLDFHLPDFDGSTSHEFGILVSTAIDESPKSNLSFEIEIVYDATEPNQREIAQFLANNPEAFSVAKVHCLSISEAIECISQAPSLRVFLLEFKNPVFSEIHPQVLRKLQTLLSSTARALWINQGGGSSLCQPHNHLVEGLFRVLASEDSNRSLHLLSLEPQNSLTARQCNHITKTINLLLTSGAVNEDMEFVEQSGLLNTPRLVASDALNNNISNKVSSCQRDMTSFDCQVPLRLNDASPGLLTGFEFVEDEDIISSPLKPDEIEIEVRCAGLNFRDILIAVGQLKASTTGSECSGVVKNVGAACEKFKIGDSVAGLHDGSFSTFIRVQENGPVVKVPEGISYADAAAVPVTFATAYVALQNIARIQPGESVLIHSATGGTGQAAIQIAKNAGATVFATVGTENKKQFLIDVYNIPESNIFSSRSTLFSRMIKLRTGGKGVDVILNSLAGESLFASWECIAPYGRFIEIGKRDILSNQRLPMLKFLDNVSYNGVDLAVMSVERPEVCTTALKSVFASMHKGDLHPPHPINLFGIGDIEKAFRLMQTGQHIGKVILEMRGSDQVKTFLKTRDCFSLDPNATFVISGGLGGLGQNISSWLVDHGARHLLLLSRSGGQSEKGRILIEHLEEKGAQVLAPPCDISDEISLKKAIAECNSSMPQIKGCFQAAMVLRDGLFEVMSHQSWIESLTPKVQGSWNLHKHLPKGMDFFIMLSSIAGILGTTGQASYAAGNTFQDALAQHRIGLGEKAISLNLGVFSFAGAVADSSQLHEQLIDNLGLKPVTEAQLYAILATYCDPNSETSSSLDNQITVGLTPSALIRNIEWANRPLTRHLIKESVGGQEDGQPSGNIGISTLLQEGSLAQASEVITEVFAQKLSSALGIAIADIDANKPLHQYGVDSLVAVELRGWFAKELQAELGVFEILGGATLSSVIQVAVRKSKLVKSS